MSKELDSTLLRPLQAHSKLATASMDEDMRDAQAGDARPSRLRSTVTAVRKQKGRGFRESMDVDDDRSMSQQYESLENTAKLHGAQKCTLCLPSGTLQLHSVLHLFLAGSRSPTRAYIWDS